MSQACLGVGPVAVLAKELKLLLPTPFLPGSGISLVVDLLRRVRACPLTVSGGLFFQKPSTNVL